MENTESYTEAFERLNTQIDGIETTLPTAKTSSKTSSNTAPPTPSAFEAAPVSKTITFKPIYLYGGVPIVVLLLFLFSQPNFLKEEVTDDKGEKTSKFSIKKTLIWTLVISTVVDVGIFAYFYQQKMKANKAV